VERTIKGVVKRIVGVIPLYRIPKPVREAAEGMPSEQLVLCWSHKQRLLKGRSFQELWETRDRDKRNLVLMILEMIGRSKNE
jgi:hypothetical protein